MSLLLQISRALDQLISLIGRTAAWLFLLLILFIVFDVITRKFGMQIPGYGSTRLQESEWHVHTVIFLIGLSFAYLRDAHVRVDLFRERFSPRTKAWVEMIGCLIFLMPYATVVTVEAWDFTMRAWASGEVSAAMTGLPHRWAIKSFLVIGFILLFLAGLAMLFNRIVYLFGPLDLREQAALDRGEGAAH